MGLGALGELLSLPSICRRSAETAALAEGDIPYVFKRFWRGDGSRSLPGNGLGLALVKAIVTSYGGSVKCESTPGEWTVFTVTGRS